MDDFEFSPVDLDDLAFDIGAILGDKETATEQKFVGGRNTVVESRSFKLNNKYFYRRAFSEIKLLDLLGIDRFKNGESYHIISGGDIDSLSFLKHIIRQQRLEYLLISTWCMAMDDVILLGGWVEEGKINRLDAYCGEIFPNQYAGVFHELKKVVAQRQGRVAIFRNHSKIFAGVGDDFAFAIESSANVNTNPRAENTTITIGDEIFHFYKDYFDGIVSFDNSFPDWKKWGVDL
uniref:Uncharacterized protein n=1 Tax=viral metagenome TaxID=1070528 RepID=A0A6M3JXT9_9ZZZZ